MQTTTSNITVPDDLFSFEPPDIESRMSWWLPGHLRIARLLARIGVRLPTWMVEQWLYEGTWWRVRGLRLGWMHYRRGTFRFEWADGVGKVTPDMSVTQLMSRKGK